MSPPKLGLGWWSRRAPTQQLVLGFAMYCVVGTLLLCLPIAQAKPGAALDHAFNVVSAVSTTGLSTISVADSYTWFGELVLLLLFQAGGIGFMTLSSVLILSRGRPLSESRLGVLRAGFSLPHYFRMQPFLVQVVVFTFACEGVGAAVLWWRFASLGAEQPLWSAIFHSVSAFATAGFSLHNDSLERYADDTVVNCTIGVLCYFGGIGFIVVQDVWYSLRLRERLLTLTSKTILWMTFALFLGGSGAMYALNPSVRELPLRDGMLAAMFQAMSASTTAGFNTIPIGAMPTSSIVVLLILMLVGASPSGTGGGIKTTGVSAILGNLWSVLRGRASVQWLGCEVPIQRVLLAMATASLYLILLMIGTFALTMSESKDFLPVVFEAASAIGTVGLSMGITGDLSATGKMIVIALMFAGRCGPLTIGLALVRPKTSPAPSGDDLAV
jgi:trk system potassium uptake protein